jgi:hypothetical protein
MSDDDDDLLFDSGDDDAQHVPKNVLAVGAVAATSEALTAHARHMVADDEYALASMVLFCDSDESGNEIFLNGRQFQAAMNWPHEPSLAEASQWLTTKRAAVDTRAAARGTDAGINVSRGAPPAAR